MAITKYYRYVSREVSQILSDCAPLDIKTEIEIDIARQIKITKMTDKIEGIKNFDFEKIPKAWGGVVRIGWEYFRDAGVSQEIYTDGAKINNQFGAAFVHYNNHVEIDFRLIRLGDQKMVFAAKVVAIAKTVDYCIENEIYDAKNNF